MANISTWSTSAASNNQATPDGYPEGQTPGSLNDCGRTLMAALRTQHESAQWIDYGHTPTKTDSDTFTVSGDQTAIYDAGRRIKFTGSVSGVATIASSSYGAPNTTVELTSAAITGTLTAVAVGIISGTSNSIPGTVWTSANDGAGSGLDADTLDGVQGSGYATTASGSFTASISGFGSALTPTIGYRVSGNLCSLFYVSGTASGLSTSTNMTMTGLPSACQPAANRLVPCAVNSSGDPIIGWASVTGDTITFRKGTVPDNSAGLFVNDSLSKGISANWTIVYPLS